MPGGDRTGPEGAGPRTGRGLGYCSGSDSPGYNNRVPAYRGYGRGYGRGMGRRHLGYGRGCYPIRYPQGISEPIPQTTASEQTQLKRIIEDLESELATLKSRLESLQKEQSNSTSTDVDSS